PAPPHFTPGGLIYELNVHSFTMRHPDIPPEQRGTVAALAHPAIIAHLQKLKVSAVEPMPIVAWIDERHLLPLGLTNAWGYNPVVPMALDPRLVPGGLAELCDTVAALHANGIGVILDLVFNHSGESDLHGGTLSFRGLDNRAYYAHEPDGSLTNITGCGNTLNCATPPMRALILDTLRHFVRTCGVDGFRFDLAPVLARDPGFNPHAWIFTAISADSLLADRVMIAEPWDIGAGGYQLGNFPGTWLEWNDRYRDDVRRFWRGDGAAGTLATRLCGSADIFGEARTRTVNFIAAHDGFTLADLVAYEHRHNEANGEGNRDGHSENFSWNSGIEGPSDDPVIRARRAADIRALLATLFASRGTIMLTAGDEFGRRQQGNNNAYAQDNPITWLDWAGRDVMLEDFVAALATLRAAHPALSDPALRHDLIWRRQDGTPMTAADWQDADHAGFDLIIPGAPQMTVGIERNACNVSIGIG
ncbi:MAG: glycogen debranching enzyme, partial [Alphaproteobacteria bacterium]|nr:glycogen debranching enzyme [Alphaproteobacteria bacterium]